MKNTKALFVAIAAAMISLPAFAQEAATEAAHAVTTSGIGIGTGLVGLAAGIAIALAVLGGTLAQAKAASAALEGIARNPAAQNKIFIPMIVALALIESLVIVCFVICNSLLGKF